MIVRALTLAGGLAGAAGLSQFPEFSQQYVQRLGGAVDELGRVVADFDASAQAEGLSREQALEQMVGTDFVERRRADMQRSFERYARLRADLGALQSAGPFTRAYQVHRFSDRDIAGRAAMAFKPAVPLNFEGAIFALVGLLAGFTMVKTLLAILRWPLRRRGSTAHATMPEQQG